MERFSRRTGEALEVNWKKLYRIYREEGLTVRKRGGRKRAMGTRTLMPIPQEPNQRWSLDFMSDALDDGRRFRVLNIIDDFSHECLACVVDTSISAAHVNWIALPSYRDIRAWWPPITGRS